MSTTVRLMSGGDVWTHGACCGVIVEAEAGSGVEGVARTDTVGANCGGLEMVADFFSAEASAPELEWHL